MQTLPHDALVLVFAEQGRHFLQHAVVPADFPDPSSITTRTTIPDDFIGADLILGPLRDALERAAILCEGG